MSFYKAVLRPNKGVFIVAEHATGFQITSWGVPDPMTQFNAVFRPKKGVNVMSGADVYTAPNGRLVYFADDFSTLKQALTSHKTGWEYKTSKCTGRVFLPYADDMPDAWNIFEFLMKQPYPQENDYFHYFKVRTLGGSTSYNWYGGIDDVNTHIDFEPKHGYLAVWTAGISDRYWFMDSLYPIQVNCP